MDEAPDCFPRYRVTTFGEPRDWLSCTSPAAMNSAGTIVGSCRANHQHLGFIFDGNGMRTVAVPNSNVSLTGIDDANYAFGSDDRNTFISVHADSSEISAVPCEHLENIGIYSVSPDGYILGSALFLKPGKKTRGFHGGIIAKHTEGFVQPFEALSLTPRVREDLASRLSSLESIDRRHLAAVSKNAKGQILVVAVRVGPNLESFPILIEPDGSMRFAFGEAWRDSPTGSGSAVLADDGSISIQARCSVPPSHTVFWCNPDQKCERCGRQEHAVFREKLRGKMSLSPQICACLDPVRPDFKKPIGYTKEEWTASYWGPHSTVSMYANSGDFWVGEVGSSGLYPGDIHGARPEGSGVGAIWKRDGDSFRFALLRDLIEDAPKLEVLGGVAINARGQIACRIVTRSGGYLGARLEPIAA